MTVDRADSPERDRDASDGSGLFSLLYVSEMARPDALEVAGICEQSRVNNLRDGITGLLVFDGQAFCQFVEGPEVVIRALLARLERDPRHGEMRLLYLGPLSGRRRFPTWRLGYAYCADPSAIAEISAKRDAGAVAAFERWSPRLMQRNGDEEHAG